MEKRKFTLANIILPEINLIGINGCFHEILPNNAVEKWEILSHWKKNFVKSTI